jgi:hypothetical protein
MKRYVVGIVAFLTLAGVIGLIVQAGGSGGNGPGGGGLSPAAREQAALHKSAPGPVAVGPTGSGASFATTTSPGSVSGGRGAEGGATANVPGLPSGGLLRGELAGPKVIETAQLSLVTKKGGFDTAYQRATEVAGRYQGYVETSSSSGVRSKNGVLTLRVPSQFFQSALRDLRSLGQVTGQSISGQDVTSQYVDLQARLRNWEAQESVLLELMSRATTVGDTLRIQNELSQVQLRIEELKGQLRVLDNQTSFSTIDVSMREAGHVAPPPPKKSSGGLVKAWRDARHGFIGVISAVVVGLGYLVPISLLLALAWIGLRRLRPRVAA